MMQKTIIFLGFILVANFSQTEFVLYGDQDKEYRTLEEKKNLFETRGMTYFNDVVIEYPNFSLLNHQRSTKRTPVTIQVSYESGVYAQAIDERRLAPMYIKWNCSEIGYGAFAAQEIKAGDFIGIYAGVLSLHSSVDKNNAVKSSGDYAWMYPIQALGRQCLIIDAELVANESAYINHSFDANVKAVYLLHKGFFFLCYIATKDIKKDEELTVHCGEPYCQARNIS